MQMGTHNFFSITVENVNHLVLLISDIINITLVLSYLNTLPLNVFTFEMSYQTVHLPFPQPTTSPPVILPFIQSEQHPHRIHLSFTNIANQSPLLEIPLIRVISILLQHIQIGLRLVNRLFKYTITSFVTCHQERDQRV